MKRPNIRLTIWLGFGSLVVLGLAMAGFGVSRMMEVGGKVERLGIPTSNVQHILEMTRELEAIHDAEATFQGTASTAARQRVADLTNMARETLATIVQLSQSEARKRSYRRLIDDLVTHARLDEEMFALCQTALDRRWDLLRLGDMLAVTVDALLAAVRAHPDAMSERAAAAVERDVLFVRVAN